MAETEHITPISEGGYTCGLCGAVASWRGPDGICGRELGRTTGGSAGWPPPGPIYCSGRLVGVAPRTERAGPAWEV